MAILAGPDYEDLELHYPLLRLLEEEAEVAVVAPSLEVVRGKRGLSVKPNLTLEEAAPTEFEAVIVPGGWAPDRLRRLHKAVGFVRDAHDAGRLIAAICHGPQLLISADVLRGRRVTCFSAIKDDVVNAGAVYLNEPVVRDGNLITSREPADLPPFCKAVVEALKE